MTILHTTGACIRNHDFIMDWQINQGIVLALQSLAHRRMKAVLLKKWQQFCLRLPHCEQTYMTYKPLGYRNETKSCELPMSWRIRWCIVLIDLSLPSSSTGPIKTCIFFLVACVILRIILNLDFLNMHTCVN